MTEAVLRTISGVKDTTKEDAATTERPLMRRRGRWECDVGKASENHRNVMGIRDADANANLAQT